MDVKVGDTIALEAERVGTPAREGEVLEIVEGATTISYRIRWTDGHTSLFTPAAGSVRVLGTAKRPTQAAKRRAKPQTKTQAKTKPASKKRT